MFLLDQVQKSLNEHLTLLRAIDSHLKLLRMDFKYPVGSPAAFLPSAKPDLTATLLPLFWEVLFMLLRTTCSSTLWSVEGPSGNKARRKETYALF
jgi:hypothetical protein